jgi:hypothetical protein
MAKRPTAGGKTAEDLFVAMGLISKLVEDFCKEHLNDEYAVMCLALITKLAQKRPSPLLSGKPNTWACGIVRTIGFVNFLHDPSQTPHIKASVIDEALGVSSSTAQTKCKQIRDLFDILQFEPQWTLPSKLGDNPIVWMLPVDGFIVDVRQCPRDFQERVFKQGLIPYIPADRTTYSSHNAPANQNVPADQKKPVNETISNKSQRTLF